MVKSMGWLPDLPDFRDYTPEHKEVQKMFKSAPSRRKKLARGEASVNLREWCSPIEDQGNLGSCTAQAVIGLVEYLQKRTKNEYLDGSRRFLYKVTRKLYGLQGDTGAYIRGTIKALKLFGVCPESYWPYETDRFDDEPPAFCYVFAQNYQAIHYFRIDTSGPEKLLLDLKNALAKGLPSCFGFTVYSSIQQREVQETGNIPFPQSGDKVIGGHAVMAVGYDEKNKTLLIRNSWGQDWGDKGYGTLPYAYIQRGLARDFWIITSLEYVSLLGL